MQGVAAARRDGILAQGRYFIPLWVGVPIFAAAVGLAVVFWWNLHRVTVGIDGPYGPWAVPPHAWHPPLSATVLDGMMVVASAGYVALGLDDPAGWRSSPLPAGGDGAEPPARGAGA